MTMPAIANAKTTDVAQGDGGAHHLPLSFGPLSGIVGFHIARAAVTTYDAFERCIGKPFDLKKAEFSLLMLVQANPGIPPKRLARALAVTAPKLTLLLDGFQQRKLIQRERNPNDGRSQHVMLTEPGRKLARSAAAAAALMETELRSPLTAAEHAMLIELLGKLARRPLP
jgi:MarR family transcriptional regulator for hemolysin